MIITRVPYRVSFFGGGTDYPTWFRQYGGRVLSTSINHYCYISCRALPSFFEHKHRLVYSQIELVQDTLQIRHPAIRGAFEQFAIADGLEIHHAGDLPARSGLGSSSSFAAALLLALHTVRGEQVNKHDLACEAIHLERHVLRENVGSQDQVATIYGGLNQIDFHPDSAKSRVGKLSSGEFSVTPVTLPPQREEALNQHLMLFFTGLTRVASEVAGEKIASLHDRAKELTAMQSMVNTARDLLSCSRTPLTDFGQLLHESWQYKRRLSERVSNKTIDDIYAAAREAGAEGGKIIGAGGGGFLLIFAKPAAQPDILTRLSHLVHVPFSFEKEGAQVLMSGQTLNTTPDNKSG